MGQFKNELLERDFIQQDFYNKYEEPQDEEEQQKVEEADVDLNEKYDEDFDTQDLSTNTEEKTIEQIIKENFVKALKEAIENSNNY